TVNIVYDRFGDGNKQILHTNIDLLPSQMGDHSAPSTTVALSGDKNNEWYYTNTVMTLNTQELATRSFYTVNNGLEQEYINSVVFDSDGIYDVKFYSIDLSGNYEQQKSVQFQIDKTAPSAPNISANTVEWTNDNVTFTVYGGTDNLS